MKNLDLTFENYSSEVNNSLKSIDSKKIDLFANKLQKALQESNKIIILGNGGSAANALHIAGDYMKTFSLLGLRPRISTPFDNLCFLTAASNDVDYSESFKIYLDSVIEKKSIIIFLSGSGNSINLIKCCNSKNINASKGVESWSIAAYEGGKISKLTTDFLHIPTKNMEIAEDMQLIIFHYIKQKIYYEVINDEKYENQINSDKYYKRTILNEVS
tara:strand:+ start:287 stop:934 length:648 start_codon:yes stop_codon:yes gene_type:complete